MEYANQRNYGTAAGDTAITQATKSPSRVASQQGLLDDNINALHNIVSVLEERLQPVLAPPQPEGPEKLADPRLRGVSTTVSQRLGDSSEELCKAINRIGKLTERLEI